MDPFEQKRRVLGKEKTFRYGWRELLSRPKQSRTVDRGRSSSTRIVRLFTTSHRINAASYGKLHKDLGLSEYFGKN
jgi:hypothetical protein